MFVILVFVCSLIFWVPEELEDHSDGILASEYSQLFPVECAHSSSTLADAIKRDETYIFIDSWGSEGSGDGQFRFPIDIAVDSSGYVYVLDYTLDRIQKFTDTGDFVMKWNTFDSSAIAVDSDDYVYLSSYIYNYPSPLDCVKVYTTDGDYVGWWGKRGTHNGEFYYLMQVAADRLGYVYTTECCVNVRVQRFTGSGEFVTKWGSEGSGDGQFDSPGGIAADNSGNIYVADEQNYRVQKFTTSGEFVTKWGSKGTGDGEFDSPRSIAVDSSGYVYVLDNILHRVQKFGISSGPPNPSYPSDKWERIWFVNEGNGEFGSYLGLGPHQVDLNFNEDWSQGPVAYERSDYLGFISSRTIYAAAGTWEFTITTDDGVRLWIDDELVLDKWFNQYETYTVERTFPSAGEHRFRLDWYEQTLGACLSFSMESVGDWEHVMLQLIEDVEEAQDAALELSRYNLDEGVAVCGKMIASVAVDVAGTVFSTVVLPELDMTFDDLPEETSQIMVQIVNRLISGVAKEDLSDSDFALTISRNAMRQYAQNLGIPQCSDFTTLTSWYQDNTDSMRSLIESTIETWRITGPPANLDSIALYWSKLLNQYTEALEKAKTGLAFYISPSRIGTMGQASEAERWWNSPLKDLGGWGLFALSITATLVGQPEFALVSKILKLWKAYRVELVWWDVMQTLVMENYYMLADFITLLNKHIMPSFSFETNGLYSNKPGAISRANLPSVSLFSSFTTGEIEYEYNWPKRTDIRVTVAFFDPYGQFLYWSMSDVLPSESSMYFEFHYYFPGLDYLIKYASNLKIFLKIFIHHMDADGQGYDSDYLSGPFNWEVDVEIGSLEIMSFKLDSSLEMMSQESVLSADLHVYDSQGRHVGLNYSTGGYDLQIPLAVYTRVTGLQSILIPILGSVSTDDEYETVIVGNSQGYCHLDISRISEGTTGYGQVFTIMTEPNESQIFFTKLTEDERIEVMIKGDVNRNDILDTGDATLILRMIVELETPDLHADMSNNGLIDTGDATLILRKVVQSDE